MIAEAIRSPLVTKQSHTLFELLDASITELPERSVVVISSKVVSLCEGRTVPKAGTDLEALIRKEAELFMPHAEPQYGYVFTIAHNMLTPNSGIDESNADGELVLWPADPQASANAMRKHLAEKFGLKDVAVIIADGNFLPLRWGASGLALAYSGIAPLRKYNEKVDLFGRPLKLTRTNVVDCLATTATLLMGEGAEQTPLAVMQDVPDVTFVDHDPTAEELAARKIPPSDDSFGPLLTALEWAPGGREA